jgi:hypothetical protein
METKDSLDTDMTAREGLHQLGYGQAMIRVGSWPFIFMLGGIDLSTECRTVACFIFSLVSLSVITHIRVHVDCLCAVTLGQSRVQAFQQLT